MRRIGTRVAPHRSYWQSIEPAVEKPSQFLMRPQGSVQRPMVPATGPGAVLVERAQHWEIVGCDISQRGRVATKVRRDRGFRECREWEEDAYRSSP